MQVSHKSKGVAAEIVTVTVCVLAAALVVALQTYQICCRP